MRHSAVLIFILAIFICSGCVTTGTKVSPSLKSVEATDGWIVGSIGGAKGILLERKGSIYRDHKLIFIKTDAKNSGGTLTYSPGEVFGLNKDFNDGDEASDLFALQLPKGSYAFVAAYFWQPQSTGGSMAEVKAPFSGPISFEVHPGETLYLGSFIATNEWPEGFPLRVNPGYPFFTLFRRSERDMPKLRSTFSALPSKTTIWSPTGFSSYLRTPESK